MLVATLAVVSVLLKQSTETRSQAINEVVADLIPGLAVGHSASYCSALTFSRNVVTNTLYKKAPHWLNKFL